MLDRLVRDHPWEAVLLFDSFSSFLDLISHQISVNYLDSKGNWWFIREVILWGKFI